MDHEDGTSWVNAEFVGLYIMPPEELAKQLVTYVVVMEYIGNWLRVTFADIS